MSPTKSTFAASEKRPLNPAFSPFLLHFQSGPISLEKPRKITNVTEPDDREIPLDLRRLISDPVSSLPQITKSLLPLATEKSLEDLAAFITAHSSLVASEVHPSVTAAFKSYKHKPSVKSIHFPVDDKLNHLLQYQQFVERLTLLLLIDYRFAMSLYITGKERLPQRPAFSEIYKDARYLEKYKSLFVGLEQIETRYIAARRAVHQTL